MAAPQKSDAPVKMISENRRVLAKYSVEERVEVGIALMGSEVKSLRGGRCELADAYATVQNGQLVLLNAYIPPYAFATVEKHAEKRERKLLAHRSEIDRIEGKISQRGYTLVALSIYFRGHMVKVELGLAKGRDGADRRHEIKRKEGEREARAAITRARKS